MRIVLQLFGGDVAMSTINARHFAPSGNITVLGPCLKQGLYSLEVLPDPVFLLSASVYALSTNNQLKRERLMKLHVRFGHCSKSKMRMALAEQPQDGLTPRDVILWDGCEDYVEANAMRVPHPKAADIKLTHFGQQIDWDCTGTQAVKTPGGATVGLLGVCRKTHEHVVYLPTQV